MGGESSHLAQKYNLILYDPRQDAGPRRSAASLGPDAHPRDGASLGASSERYLEHLVHPQAGDCQAAGPVCGVEVQVIALRLQPNL